MLGKIIGDIRNYYEIPPEKLAEGICSVGMLRKYEAQEEEMEKLLADALLQRLGKSMDKYDVMLDLQEYWQAETRCRIQVLLRRGELDEAERQIQEYENRIKKDRQLHEQFLALQRVELGRRRGFLAQEQERMVVDGLGRTIAAFQMENRPEPSMMGSRYFHMLELLLLERYAMLQEELGREEIAALWYQELAHYMEPKQTEAESTKDMEYDRTDRNKLYPILLYQQAGLLRKKKSYEQALICLEKARELLSEAQNQCPLFVRVMERKFQIQREAGQAVAGWEENALTQLLQVIGEQEKVWREDWHPMYEELHIHSVNRIVRERRLMHGWSEEELALDICDVRTVKRAEREESKLQRKNRDMLLERLGVSNIKYDGGILTARYSDYKKFGKMISVLGQGDAVEAEKLYLELKKGIRKPCITNRQFEAYWEVMIRHQKGEVDRTQCCKKLWEIIGWTLPVTEAGLRGKCTFTEYEREALLHLAWHDNGTYWKELKPLLWEQYQRLDVVGKERYFYRHYYIGLVHCMAKLWRRYGEIELAEQILENGMQQQLYLHEEIYWGHLLFGKFCLEIEKGATKPKTAEVFFWLRSAYAISKLYLKNTSFQNFLKRYKNHHYPEVDFSDYEQID